jgi:uncharacterized membrane protein
MTNYICLMGGCGTAFCLLCLIIAVVFLIGIVTIMDIGTSKKQTKEPTKKRRIRKTRCLNENQRNS